MADPRQVSWLVFTGVRWMGVSFHGMNKKSEENEPRRSSWFVFWTYWLGLPYPGCPLVYLPPPFPPFLRRANLSGPYPYGKGGADAAGCAFPTKSRHFNLSPHPSREGRGSFPGCRLWLTAKSEVGAKVVVMGWVEDERISTVMGLI